MFPFFAKTPAWMTLIDAQELGTPLQTTWLRRHDYWPHSAVDPSEVRRGLVYPILQGGWWLSKAVMNASGKGVPRRPLSFRSASQQSDDRWACALSKSECKMLCTPTQGSGEVPKCFPAVLSFQLLNKTVIVLKAVEVREAALLSSVFYG